MTFKKQIEITDGKNIVGKVSLTCSVESTSAIVHYEDFKGRSGELAGYSFFVVLSEIRNFYREEGLDLLCMGGLIDVYTSGYISSSSFGEMAYQIDASTGEKKIVNIFEGIDLKDMHRLSDIQTQKKVRKEVIRKLRTRV